MAIITAHIDDYKKAQSPDMLDSGPLGSCIGIGAISTRSGVNYGFIAHAMAAFLYKTTFPKLEDFFVDLQEERENNLRIYVLGGAMPRNKSKETLASFVGLDRAFVLEELERRDLDSKIVEVRWGRAGGIQRLKLNLSLGEPIFSSHKLSRAKKA